MTTKAQMQSSIKHMKKYYKRIPLDVKLEKYDEIKAHAEKNSESVNGFIKRAIDETMLRDNKG